MPLAPLHLRPVRRLLFAYGVNQLGDWAGELALAVAVYTATRSAAAVAVAATWVAHRALLALLAPALVAALDQRARMRALPSLYLIQAGLFAAIAALAPLGLWSLLPLVAIDGLLAPTARALARTALAGVARPQGLLREANALANMIFTANGVLAPIIGGLLVAAAGPQAALGLDAASFVLAAGAVRRVRTPGASDGSRSGVVRLREGITHVRSRPILNGLVSGDAVLMVFISSITPVEVVFVTDTLGAGNAALGAVLTAWGAGMVTGGAAAAHWREIPLPALLGGASLALGVSCLGMGLSGAVGEVLVWSAIGGIGNGAYGMALLTALQERTAEVFQAHVNGLYETVSSIAPGAGFALGGAVAALASPRAVYLLAGIGGLAALIWAAARLRHADWSCAVPALAGGSAEAHHSLEAQLPA